MAFEEKMDIESEDSLNLDQLFEEDENQLLQSPPVNHHNDVTGQNNGDANNIEPEIIQNNEPNANGDVSTNEADGENRVQENLVAHDLLRVEPVNNIRHGVRQAVRGRVRNYNRLDHRRSNRNRENHHDNGQWNRGRPQRQSGNHEPGHNRRIDYPRDFNRHQRRPYRYPQLAPRPFTMNSRPQRQSRNHEPGHNRRIDYPGDFNRHQRRPYRRPQLAPRPFTMNRNTRSNMQEHPRHFSNYHHRMVARPFEIDGTQNQTDLDEGLDEFADILLAVSRRIQRRNNNCGQHRTHNRGRGF